MSQYGASVPLVPQNLQRPLCITYIYLAGRYNSVPTSETLAVYSNTIHGASVCCVIRHLQLSFLFCKLATYEIERV